jgi:transposase
MVGPDRRTGSSAASRAAHQQLDALEPLRQGARRDLLAESRKHQAAKLLRQIPYLGPIRSALLVALLETPQRFRTKRQLWAYSGFGLETHDMLCYQPWALHPTRHSTGESESHAARVTPPRAYWN